MIWRHSGQSIISGCREEPGQAKDCLSQCAGAAAFAVFGAGGEIGRSLIRGNKFYLGER